MAATILLQSGDVLTALNETLPYSDAHWYTGVGSLDYHGPDCLDPDTIWREQRAVRTVVGFIARNVASIGLHGYKDDDEGPTRIRDAHPLGKILKSPDGVQTQYEFLYDLIVDVCLWDRSACAKVRLPDGRAGLMRVPPAKWKFERGPSKAGPPQGIRIGQEVLPLERFLWTDGYPSSEDSPMRHLQSLLAEEAASAAYRRDLWERGARLGGVVQRPAEAPDWSPRARRRFQESFRQAYTGEDASRPGGVALLEDGMTYQDVASMSSRDAQQIEARKLAVTEVASSYHVPPVFVGVLDNANYSNVKVYRQMLYSDVLGPLLVQSQQAWTLRLAADFGGVDYVAYAVADKLMLSFEEQATVLQSAVGTPYVTPNEGRARIGLRKIDGGDELAKPLNMAGEATEEEPPAEEPAEEETAPAEEGDE